MTTDTTSLADKKDAAQSSPCGMHFFVCCPTLALAGSPKYSRAYMAKRLNRVSGTSPRVILIRMVALCVTGCWSLCVMYWWGSNYYYYSSEKYKLLIVALLISATSSMLYKRYKSKWPTLSSQTSASSRSSPSQLLHMRKQLDATYKSMSRFGTRSETRDTCRAHPLTLELEPPLKLADQCGSLSVLSYGCRGGCSSYSQVDPRNATNIIHSCSCCQPLRFMVSIALLPCRDGHNLKVLFKEARLCSCRPCYAEEATKDYLRFDDLLSKPAVETPLPIG